MPEALGSVTHDTAPPDTRAAIVYLDHEVRAAQADIQKLYAGFDSRDTRAELDALWQGLNEITGIVGDLARQIGDLAQKI